MSQSQQTFSPLYRWIPHVFDLPNEDLIAFVDSLTSDSTSIFLDASAGPNDLRQYSFFAWKPVALFEANLEKSVWQDPRGGEHHFAGHPLDFFDQVSRSFQLDRENSPFPFMGGWMGWITYEAGQMMERLPPGPQDSLGFPLIHLGLFDQVILRDHARNRNHLIVCEWEGDPHKSGEKYLEECVQQVLQNLKPKISASSFQCDKLRSDQTKLEYEKRVQKALRHIHDGDIYQVNLSQEFEGTVEGDSLTLYQSLRRETPAPYSAFIQTPHGDVFSTSPERYLRIEGDQIETRPIKGTRPRVKDENKNADAKKELLESEKDRAELTMIVDLERNDLKRVCVPGSVTVPRLFDLEQYATVFHLVSTVQGKLRDEVGWSDIFKATFPGGSITGAPKIRAMEIIGALEESARSIYTGAIGWMGLDGDADLNIAIRTLIRKGNRIVFRVGGGIVADSVPAKEYQETLDKGLGMAQALGQTLSP